MNLFRATVSAVLAAGIALGVNSCGAFTDQTATCTVTGKDRSMVGYGKDARSQMRVYTEQCGTFEVGDSILKGQWRSADLFGSLKEGHTYRIVYNGYRSGPLSLFPNITKAEEVR